MSDAAEVTEGEPVDPTTLANFLMEHIEEQENAFTAALNDLNGIDWFSKALGSLRTNNAEQVAEAIRQETEKAYRRLPSQGPRVKIG